MSIVNPISSSCQSIASVATNTASSLGASGCMVGAGIGIGIGTGVGGGSLGIGGSGSLRSSSNTSEHNTQQSHYVNGTGSLGRLKYYHKHKNSLDASDEELDYTQLSQSTHVIGRVKSERFLATAKTPDDDRRRRTIIVEKKNDSYGFTLQSYGIHYKRDEEVKMLTYVDYVEYDGPAYRAGMREGDVILAINGRDVAKVDHQTLVDCIKACDTRMRMVVAFEDCVRKVELHMRYMHLQNLLQSKLNELERVCMRERELLEGKWKTHSLPARKKAVSSPTDADAGASPTDSDIQPSYYRPTLSTENVAHLPRHQQAHHQPVAAIIPPPAQFMLTYHYLDPTYRYVLKPSTSASSGEYFVSLGEASGLQRTPSDQHFVLSRAASGETATTASAASTMHFSQQQQQQQRQPPMPPPRTCEKHKPPGRQPSPQQQTKSESATPKKAHKASGKHCHGHSCNPCIGHFRWKSADKAAAATSTPGGGGGGGGNSGDNVSLDAYDLASPCCDTHCVPSRRRSRHHKDHTHTHKHKHRDRERERDSKERPKSQIGGGGGAQQPQHVHHHHHHQSAEAAQQQQQQHQGSSAHQHQHSHHHRHVHASQQQQQQQAPHHHPQQQQQLVYGSGGFDSHSGSVHSRYYDLAAGLASHCSLHSCTSSDFAPAADSTSYTTSLSTDTLYWDPKSENATSRQHSTKSRQSYTQQQQQQHSQQQHQQQQQHEQQQHLRSIYQHRYHHITTTQIQPTQIYPSAAGGGGFHKPKSWDNLATKDMGGGAAAGGVGYGGGRFGYLETMAASAALKQPPAAAMRLHMAQQRHSIPRKNPYGRYSTYAEAVENYAPPPQQFLEELTTTTTTTITAKSAEELVAAAVPQPQQQQTMCECFTKQQPSHQHHHHHHQQKSTPLQMSQSQQYYAHLPRSTSDAATSTGGGQMETLVVSGGGDVVVGDVTTTSEITRL